MDVITYPCWDSIICLDNGWGPENIYQWNTPIFAQDNEFENASSKSIAILP